MEQNNEEYYLQLIAGYLSGEASEFEKNLLFEWVQSSQDNKKFFLQTQKAWKLTGQQQQIIFDAGKAWLKIKPSIVIEKEKPAEENNVKVIPLKKGRAIPYMRIAAMLAIVVGTLLLLWKIRNKNSSDTIAIHTGSEKKTIFLPDSSKVFLNKNTSFTYSPSFLEERKVSLKGEAYFEVRKHQGKKFEIRTQKAITIVLGTSFNIDAKEGKREEIIKVFSGKVAYAKLEESDRKVILTKGMQARLSKQSPLKVDTFNTSTGGIKWKQSQLSFESDKIGEIFSTMESYFDTEIKTTDPNILQCRFTGNFSHPELEEMLKVITVSLDASYTFKNGQYIISGHGCD